MKKNIFAKLKKNDLLIICKNHVKLIKENDVKAMLILILSTWSMLISIKLY